MPLTERLYYRKSDIVGIPFRKSSGPFEEMVIARSGFRPDTINCQAAMQLFYYRVVAVSLAPEMALSEEGYKYTGITVTEENPSAKDYIQFFKDLQFADVIYSIPRKKIGRVDTETSKGQRELHVSIMIRRSNRTNPIINTFYEEMGLPDEDFVFHATQNGGKNKTCIEPIDDFIKEYAPIKAKRLVSLPDYDAYLDDSLT